MSVRSQIEKFMNIYNDFILEEDLRIIKNFINMLNTYEDKQLVESKYGKHFNNCPWSKNQSSEGPDTCQCIVFRYRKNYILSLIEKYNNNFIKFV